LRGASHDFLGWRDRNTGGKQSRLDAIDSGDYNETISISGKYDLYKPLSRVRKRSALIKD